MPFWFKSKSKKEKLEIALKRRDEAIARNEQLENSNRELMQDKEKLTDTLIKTIQGRDNFADVLMRLIQQIQKERENLAARSNQLEELAQTLQIQAKKNSEETMRIVIKYYCNNELRLDVKASDTIGQVKVMVQKKTGVPPRRQRLSFLGIVLDDEWTIEKCGIQKGSAIYLPRL